MQPGTAKIVFLNKHGKVVNRNSWVHEGHFYIDYPSALRACEQHLARCDEGAYVTINDQPKYTLSQMDLALYHFFND